MITEKIKESIIQDVSSGVDAILSGIEAEEDKLNGVKETLSSKTDELVALDNQLSKLREEERTMLRTLEVARDEMVKERREANDNLEAIDEAAASAKAEVELAERVKKSLKKEVITLKAELESMDVLRARKDSLSNELKDLAKAIDKKEKELSKLKESGDAIEREQLKNIEIRNKEIKALDVKLEKTRNTILPSLEDLRKREKKVESREADMDIVIKRYKKLYGDKGAGFKV